MISSNPLQRRCSQYPPAIIEKFKETAHTLRQSSEMLQRVDWLVSDDDSDESFLSRWEGEVRPCWENIKKGAERQVKIQKKQRKIISTGIHINNERKVCGHLAENEDKDHGKPTDTTNTGDWVTTGHPPKKGWYVTREEGFLKWRAWGKGCWWSQRKDGWLGHFNDMSEATLYDWLPETRENIALDVWQLPSCVGTHDPSFTDRQVWCLTHERVAEMLRIHDDD